MTRIQIAGSIPLNGEICVQGSKNGVLPILAAAVLHKGTTVLHNCPKILDVEYMTEIMRGLGCRIKWQDHSLEIDSREICSDLIKEEQASKLRASVLLMGSLLGRCRCAGIPYPGGCLIGSRPIDLHLYAMKCLGCVVHEESRMVWLDGMHLRGNKIRLPFPSVGATENAILAAVLAKGETTIHGCAQEPEIVELCRFLKEKGAEIHGIGTCKLTIHGVHTLQDSEYRLMPDRIVAGSYLCAAAGTMGKIRIAEVIPEHLQELLHRLREMGASVETGTDWISLDASKKKLRAENLVTAPYPGFPTDLQSQMMAVMTTADGISRIREELFESRFQTASELCHMGAKIEIKDRTALVTGVPNLVGCRVRAHDLRGGAALVIAGLMAQGKTTVEESRFIDRGYEDICGDLQQLGAQICREGVNYATAKEKKEESAETVTACVCGSGGIWAGHSLRIVSYPGGGCDRK